MVALKSPKIIVTVDAESIANSMIANSSHCMISDSIKKLHPEFTMISTDLQTIRVSDQSAKLRYIYFTPRPAQERIVDFDEGLGVEPFTFVLQRAAQILRTRDPDQQRQTRERAATGKNFNTHNDPKVAQRVGGRAVPTVIGGRAPPRAIVSGTRRAFGIKGLRGAKPRG